MNGRICYYKRKKCNKNVKKQPKQKRKKKQKKKRETNGKDKKKTNQRKRNVYLNIHKTYYLMGKTVNQSKLAETNQIGST